MEGKVVSGEKRMGGGGWLGLPVEVWGEIFGYLVMVEGVTAFKRVGMSCRGGRGMVGLVLEKYGVSLGERVVQMDDMSADWSIGEERRGRAMERFERGYWFFRLLDGFKGAETQGEAMVALRKQYVKFVEWCMGEVVKSYGMAQNGESEGFMLLGRDSKESTFGNKLLGDIELYYTMVSKWGGVFSGAKGVRKHWEDIGEVVMICAHILTVNSGKDLVMLHTVKGLVKAAMLVGGEWSWGVFRGLMDALIVGIRKGIKVDEGSIAELLGMAGGYYGNDPGKLKEVGVIRQNIKKVQEDVALGPVYGWNEEFFNFGRFWGFEGIRGLNV